jgi:hypothetical protein
LNRVAHSSDVFDGMRYSPTLPDANLFSLSLSYAPFLQMVFPYRKEMNYDRCREYRWLVHDERYRATLPETARVISQKVDGKVEARKFYYISYI